jgi:hypothetical protein
MYVGGIRLSSEDMRNHYTKTKKSKINTAGYALKDIVFDVTILQGEHGRPENFGLPSIDDWYFKPSPYEQIIELRDYLVDDMNSGDDPQNIISRAYAIANKKWDSYFLKR